TSVVINLAAGDEKNLNLDLDQPAELGGWVQTPTGTRLCGWAVDLFLQDQYPFTPLHTTTTKTKLDANGNCTSGTFTVKDTPAGTYIISVGPAPGNPTTTVRKTLRPSQQLTNIAVTAQP